MILVMLGTNPYPFDRLLKAIENWAEQSGERVVVQSGHTTVNSGLVEGHDFVSHVRILEWIDEAELVITQGGFGSLRDCLTARKPTIAVPRLREYGECQDEQAEVVDALAEEGRVIPLYDVGDLAGAIKRARHLVAPQPEMSSIPRLVAEAVEAALATA